MKPGVHYQTKPGRLVEGHPGPANMDKGKNQPGQQKWPGLRSPPNSHTFPKGARWKNDATITRLVPHQGEMESTLLFHSDLIALEKGVDAG